MPFFFPHPREISDLSYDDLAVVTFTLLTLRMIKLNDLHQEYFFHANKSGKNSSCFCMKKKKKAFGLTLCICLRRINAMHKVRKELYGLLRNADSCGRSCERIMFSQACVPLQSVHTIHCQTLSDAYSILDSWKWKILSGLNLWKVSWKLFISNVSVTVVWHV